MYNENGLSYITCTKKYRKIVMSTVYRGRLFSRKNTFFFFYCCFQSVFPSIGIPTANDTNASNHTDYLLVCIPYLLFHIISRALRGPVRTSTVRSLRSYFFFFGINSDYNYCNVRAGSSLSSNCALNTRNGNGYHRRTARFSMDSDLDKM